MPDRRGSLAAMARDLGSRRTVGTLIAVCVAFLLVSVTAGYQAIGQFNEASERVEHTLRAGSTINRLAALNEQIETARRGQMLAPGLSFVKLLRSTSDEFSKVLGDVESLTSDNAVQQDRIREVERLHAQRQPLIESVILTPMTVAGSAREVGLDREQGVRIARRIRALTVQMALTESDLLSARTVAQTRSATRFYAIGGLATLLFLVFLVAVIIVVVRYNRELGEAQTRLRASNDRLEDSVAERTKELTRANQEIQRFAYIVSHDLRSPLVNVLGFTAELDQSRKDIRKFLEDLFAEQPQLRNEAVWLAADEDVPEALDFIRKSTEKMDRLINSILELSRQGRRQLAPERLDMNTLADGVVASLHQRAEQAGAEVIVAPIPALESDRIAVEQILSNLVENALKYLQPGRAGKIVVQGQRRGRMVEVSVADNGRGIAPDDHERVFELFRRAGTQDQAGEGIGLANVRALAYRLGGNIELRSALGEGSTFTLSLPESFVGGENLS